MDFIVDYYENYELIKETFQTDCYQEVNNRYTVVYYRVRRDIDESRLGNGVYLPKIYGLMDSTAVLGSIGVEQVRRQPGLALYGQGVLIGIIDTGVDYRHEAFLNADGTTRLWSIWDQTGEGEPPEGFEYGVEYSREKINEALAAANPLEVVPFRDEIGHGTFLAGVAAGNIEEDEDFSGVAPLADIIAVKLKPAKENIKRFYFMETNAPCYQENDIMIAVRYLIQKAEQSLKPLVILLGVGTNLGDHRGSGPLGEYLSESSLRRSLAIVCAGGNELNRAHHYYSGEVLGGGQQEVEIKVGEQEKGFTMQLWGGQRNLFSVELVSPSGEYSGRITARQGQVQRIPFLLEKSTVYVSYQLLSGGSGLEKIMLRFDSPAAGNWRIRVFNLNMTSGSFHTWLPIEGFIEPDTIFLQPDPDDTICEPGCVKQVITNATSDYRTSSLYIYSSRGFIDGDHIKPDITAPGVDIFGPYVGISNDNYSTMTGSSVGAAFTAGVVVLLMEWAFILLNDFSVNGVVAKNYLIRGASRKGITYPSIEWGWGNLDAYGMFEAVRTRA